MFLTKVVFFQMNLIEKERGQGSLEYTWESDFSDWESKNEKGVADNEEII